MSSKHARWGIAIVALAALLIGVLWPRPVAKTEGTLPQAAYVWQRAWTDPVRESIAQRQTNFSKLILLAAEVQWDQGQPKTFRVPLPFDLIRSVRCPLGLALRIGPFSGPFATDDRRAQRLRELSGSLLQEAASNGLSVAELQIDFDCAESRLDGYRRWVLALKQAAGPVPVTVTALPVWLRHGEFQRLADTADGFVLQVHSLERPQNADAPFTLCRVEAACQAVERAARFGRPFRVALPTYGYVVAFDATGTFVGLSAEGPPIDWPESMTLKEIRADPETMAGLVRAWSVTRPKLMEGVIWYRLPIPGERLNWAWPTLEAVMAGHTPQPSLHAAVRSPQAGLWEVQIANIGQADYARAVAIHVRWDQARLVASDGLGGFESVWLSPNAVEFRSPAIVPRLQPGQIQTIGWVRLDQEVKVAVEIVSENPKRVRR